jgi:hypothetical protein
MRVESREVGFWLVAKKKKKIYLLWKGGGADTVNLSRSLLCLRQRYGGLLFSGRMAGVNVKGSQDINIW